MASACGGFLIALSIYQAEFDFGVPQFRLLFDPVLVAFAAGAGLVTARAMLGRGGALAAMAFFVGFRLILMLIVTGALGETVAHFPLYFAEAVLVEGVALALGTDKRYRFAVVSGVLIGTVGVAAELAWTQVWSAIVWPVHVLPDAMLFAVITGIAGAVLGAFISGGLQRRVDLVGSPRTWAAAGLSVLAFAGVVGYLLQTNTVDAKAIVTLEEVTPPPNRTVNATVRFSPESAIGRPDWLNTLAWQGQTKLENHPLVAVGDGTYKTSAPAPGLRIVEDDAAVPPGQRPLLGARLAARGRGDSRSRGPGRGELHPPLPGRPQPDAARGQAGRSDLPLDGRRHRGALDLDDPVPAGRLEPGAGCPRRVAGAQGERRAGIALAPGGCVRMSACSSSHTPATG